MKEEMDLDTPIKPHGEGMSCPTCGEGTISAVLIHNYKTHVRGFPFTVGQAYLGQCDRCDEQPVHGKELKRWEALFERSLAERHALLTAEEITRLRQSMDLNKKDFARLLGVSLRSIHIWEKQGRQSVSSRGADLLMKLVAASLREGKVDAIELLLDEAQKWGMELEVRRTLVEEAAG